MSEITADDVYYEYIDKNENVGCSYDRRVQLDKVIELLLEHLDVKIVGESSWAFLEDKGDHHE